MIFAISPPLMASELAERLDCRLAGADVEVSSIAPYGEAVSGSLTYWHSDKRLPADTSSGTCVVAATNVCGDTQGDIACLYCDNARLGFVRLLRSLSDSGHCPEESDGVVDESADVHPSAIVEPGAAIGANSRIGPGVHVRASCVIGEGVSIGANSALGHAGFGFERDDEGVPVEFPHLGRLIIGSGCSIGCGTTIARGNLSDTVLDKNVKIDDQVYIAHNCIIGESTMVAGGARLCGGVTVGQRCWIGAGSMIRQGLSVGDDATIGLGAVVVRSVASATVIAGNPAQPLVKN